MKESNKFIALERNTKIKCDSNHLNTSGTYHLVTKSLLQYLQNICTMSVVSLVTALKDFKSTRFEISMR